MIHNTILFQGDSITDAGRSRFSSGANSPEGMGFGYPRLVMEMFTDRYPDRPVQFYNRGVSGNRIQDLASRWQQDTLNLHPDLISVLIGVNDTWNYLSLGLGSSPEGFQRIYRQLLMASQEKLPGVIFVLCEPFLLLTGEVNEEWQEDIVKRQRHVCDLAEEFKAIFVPFQSVLDDAVSQGVPKGQLLDDGVHPTQRGHRLLADCWLSHVVGN
jgi:lysophospholipase L1-like esterase